MKFSEYIQTAKGISIYDKEAGWSSNVFEMFTALLANTLGLYGEMADYDDIQALKAVLGDQALVYTIVDVPHDSDESASHQVLAVAGVPVLSFTREGDRSSYEAGLVILNKALATAIVQTIVARKVANSIDVEDVEDLTVDQLLTVPTYLTSIGDGMFVVGSPRWALSMPSVVKDYPCVAYDKGELVPVLKMEGWADLQRHSQSTQAIVQTAKGVLTVDAKDLVFTIGQSFTEAQLATLKLAFEIEPNWVVTRVIESLQSVSIEQKRPLSMQIDRRIVPFVSKEACYQFEAAIGKDVQQGVFNPKDYPNTKEN